MGLKEEGAERLEMESAEVALKTPEHELSFDEAYETFLLAGRRGTKASRGAALAILTLLGALMTAAYALDRTRLDAFPLALLCALVFIAAGAAPFRKARSGAKAVARRRGACLASLGIGFITTPNGERRPLKGDKRAGAFETSRLFAVRPGRLHAFCLPKRILSSDQIERIREILSKNVVKLTTEKEG